MAPLITLKKILGLLLFLLLFFLSVAVPVRAETLLLGVQKQEDPSRTRLTFLVSAVTGFKVDSSGQRVELTIEGATAGATLGRLSEDGTLVRMTLIRKQQDLVVSLLLRRTPHQITSESYDNPARIVMDIDWHGEDAVRPGVAFRVSDMPPRRAGAAATAYQQQSPWEGRWQEFFSDYRSDWNIRIPLQFTPPPPLEPVVDEQSPLIHLQRHADQKMYLSLLKSAAELRNLENSDRYLRDLMMADAFLRTGSFASGLARLESLQTQKGAHQIRVDYLTAWGEAAGGNPIGALLHLQMTLAEPAPTDPLAAAVSLIYAEAALATAQYQQALDKLTDVTITWPAELKTARRIRTADARAGLGGKDLALQEYRNLAEQPQLCEFYHSSCNRAAYAAFQVGDYESARQLYRRLALEFSNQKEADLIHFAAGAAAYAAGDFDWGWIGLEQVTQDYPSTEGGDRAALRLLDIRIINGGSAAMAEAVSGYAALAQRATTRQIREESSFKEALALFLGGEHRRSVDRLMTFQRDFAGSSLRRESRLLLAQQLPLVVEQLLEQGHDLQAVVLVEQNRELLLVSRYERSFLHNLVRAFDRLGLYDRSARVLLYLFDQSAGSPEQKEIFLPLARSFMQRDQYLAAGDYARQYLASYPSGEDAGALFVLLLDSLERGNHQDQMLDWLQRSERPDSPDVDIRAARIYWQQKDYAAVIDYLERAATYGPLQSQELACLAEAHYQQKNFSASLNGYRAVQEDPAFTSQARYRSAQIMLHLGERPAAIAQLEKLVKEDAGSAWGKLARDLLIQQQRRNF